MGATKTGDPRRFVSIVMAIAFATGLAFFLIGRQRPPQIGDDAGVNKTVDALFTAITSRDNQRLGECERRLKSYVATGTLPSNSANRLDTIIQQARSGHWNSASHELYDFIRGQRRG